MARGNIHRMPEDPNFGDIDDAQLEAAMAALLQTPSSARNESPSDLELLPWAPDAVVGSDVALEEAGFGGPLHAALGDLADINSGIYASSPPEEPPHAPTSPSSAPKRSRFAEGAAAWSARKRELLPGLIVALLVVLGLVVVVTSMTGGDGDNSNISASAPTSALVTSTTIRLDTIPPPPSPPPVEIGAPPATPSVPASGFAPKRFRSPGKRGAAPNPSLAPASSDPGPGTTTPPEPPSSTPTPTIPQGTSVPPTPSSSTTVPPTTSSSTTQAPRDRCANFSGRTLEECLQFTGG